MKVKRASQRKDQLLALEKQLMAYSIAAAVILAGTKDAKAGIVHTDVNPDEVLDMNGDEFEIVFSTQTKFKIKFAKDEWTQRSTSFSTYSITNTVTNVHTHTHHTTGSLSTPTTTTTKQYFGTWVKFYQTNTYTKNKVGVFPEAGNSFVKSGGYAKAMSAGSVIGPANSFNNAGSASNMAYYSNFTGWSSGPFLGTSNKYLGLKFKISSDTYYGWAHVEVASDASSATITDYAYETTIGLGIKAGETDVSLAVSISELEAVQGETGVRLSWSMEATQDFLGFIIERQSLNNQGESISEWEEIASYKTHNELRGDSNQSSRQTYVFKDPGAVSSTRYQYRLSEANLSGQIVSQKIIEARAVSVPIEFSLNQNYPNPFNPFTKIQFGLPEKTKVTLTIYNVKGQIIDVVLDKTMDAGYHTVNYDASLLSSGVYLYEVKNGNERLIKKMQVIK